MRYYDKESKTVKDMEKEIKALEDTVSRIAGEVDGIVTPLNAVGKAFLSKLIRLGNRVLFHGPAGALTKEFEGWLKSGSDHLGRLFEGGDSMMNHRGPKPRPRLCYTILLEPTCRMYPNIQNTSHQYILSQKAQNVTPIAIDRPKTQQAAHQ